MVVLVVSAAAVLSFSPGWRGAQRTSGGGLDYWPPKDKPAGLREEST